METHGHKSRLGLDTASGRVREGSVVTDEAAQAQRREDPERL